MGPREKSILTEDGQRLTVEEDEIVGTEDTNPGLAYNTGNIAPEEVKEDKVETRSPQTKNADEKR